jgi:ABC-type bacteriocin/lantibiotic exporter with double-glycine peptidase domain
MVLEYCGVRQDEVTLTMLCKTTLTGTGLAEIYEAAQYLGLESEWKKQAKYSDLTAALKRGIPIITMVDASILYKLQASNPVGHMIVIFAIAGDEVFYHDPAIGPGQKTSRDIFMASWEALRKGMVILWQKNKTPQKRVKR